MAEYYKELRKYVGQRPLLLPGATVIVENAEGEILLQARHDDTWGLPGGLMEPGESFEETGLTLGTMTLIEVFSGKAYYRKLRNGDEFLRRNGVVSDGGVFRRTEDRPRRDEGFALLRPGASAGAAGTRVCGAS